MGDMPAKRTEHALKMKEAGEKILEIQKKGASVPRDYFTHVLIAMTAFATKVLEEPHPQEILNALTKLSADTYGRDTQMKDMIRRIGDQPCHGVGAEGKR